MTDGVIENFCLILKSKTAYFINCYFYLNRVTIHKKMYYYGIRFLNKPVKIIKALKCFFLLFHILRQGMKT